MEFRVDGAKQPRDLLAREHHRHMHSRTWSADSIHSGQIHIEYVAVQVEHHRECLAVRRRRDVLIARELGEEPARRPAPRVCGNGAVR